MSLRHPAGLAAFVRAVSDPASPQYRHYASVAALERRFGASEARRSRVQSWLRARGAHTQAFGSVILGDVPEALFAHGVPAALRPDVASESSVPEVRFAPLLAPTGNLGSGRPRTGTPSGCAEGRDAGYGGRFAGFTPGQITTAYGYSRLRSRGLLGQGERIALVEYAGFVPGDVRQFAACFGFPAPRIATHLVGIRKLPVPSLEPDLDIELINAAAPRLAGIDVYDVQTQSPIAGLLAGLEAALHARGGPPAAISLSIGGCESFFTASTGFMRAIDDVLAVAAGAGVTTLMGAGDWGSTNCTPVGSPPFPFVNALFPSSSPYVLSIGGTGVTLTAGNELLTQVVWNDTPFALRGGGGAPSLFEPRPWWQRGPGLQPSLLGGVTRITPDIAAYADDLPGYAIFCTAEPCPLLPQASPGWITTGGTSALGPLYAGGVALIDQDARRHGQRPVGLLDPLLYAVAAGPEARRTFWDVTKGTNDLGEAIPAALGGGSPVGCCSARRGYDDASGWGSVNVTQLDADALRAGSR